jgi:hypothetical protein
VEKRVQMGENICKMSSNRGGYLYGGGDEIRFFGFLELKWSK